MLPSFIFTVFFGGVALPGLGGGVHGGVEVVVVVVHVGDGARRTALRVAGVQVQAGRVRRDFAQIQRLLSRKKKCCR